MKGALEENVLTMLCWDVTHAPGLAMRVTADMFSNKQYQEIAAASLNHLQSFGKPPQGHIRDLLEKRLARGKDGELLAIAVNAMTELFTSLQSDYVLAELDTFIASRALGRAIEDAADHLQAGDLAKAREALSQEQRSQPLSRGTLFHDTDKSMSFFDEEEDDEFTMGIDALDERGIRPERGTITCLIAPAKRGKTQFLTNVGSRNIMRRKHVLHITLENGEKKMCGRYTQTFFGMTKSEAKSLRVPMFKRGGGSKPQIDFDTVTPKVMTRGNRKMISDKAKRVGRNADLMIKEFPSGTLTIAQLRAYLVWLRSSENFIPDMMILDYPAIMAIDPKHIRVELGRMFVNLRGLAQEFDLALVTVAQGNRISSTQKTVAANQVGEDYSIIGTVDTALTYSQTAEERGIGLARIFVAAARNDADQYIVLISQLYETAQFCLDSVYMERHFTDEVARLTGAGNDDDGDD